MSMFRTAFLLLAMAALGAPWRDASAVQATAASSAAPVASSGAAAEMISRAEVSRIIGNTRRIVSPNGVDERIKLRIGGIDQWLSIRGRDRRNPILLFLHGGPAAVTMPASYTFQSPWEDFFTVVQWDQRGAGKTYAANTEQQMSPGMTIEGMTDDAAQVVQYLRQHYGKRKIFLLGHSWGTVLGTRLARQHPDWFHAYIGVGQVVNVRRNEEIGFAFALRAAKADHNPQAVRELEALMPYPGTVPMTLQRIGTRSKWETYYGGLTHGRKDFSYEADAEGLSPDYDQAGLDAIGKGSVYTLNHLLQPLLDVDLDDMTDFGCPVILFVGQHDYTTSHELAEQWFGRIHAPSKHMVLFADSAHMVMQEQPGRFLMHLVTDALPLAQKLGDAAPAEVTRGD
ncbi:alpha/beta fold hydrolase [Rhodanobacter spathiphylli]|uniref:Proline iminopeptidase n=1 Tax=Rhodanobacter spathiphylli B39 TaxID=1163407 RepID=I4VSF4_9GAMM|nr:alpha/beta hydrolase [Rhodanobacter spathiphylli]EIL90145.1 hydrolase, alpha/beta fold family protein [Rhodanobacter spathiphylli B39]